MIEIFVLNSDLERVAVFDKYKSFIWTDRYNEAGEFEFYLPVTANRAQSIKKDMFLSIPTSDRMMVIESIKIESDPEDGNFYLITGRSLESILDRRIVWKQTVVDGSIQDALHQMINDAIISPTDSRRRISNFVFEESNEHDITDLSYSKKAQYMGDSLYDVVKKVCQAEHIGFKIEVNSANEFVFSLYAGIDKSDSTKDPYLVFSPTYDNLLNSNYLESIKNYKNVLRIAGEGEGATQTFITHYVEFDNDHASEKVGLARREIYIDCHDVSSITDGQTVMDVEQYTNTLVRKGIEKMVDLVPETAFEGEVDATIMYKYQEDFELGDICEIQNEYGMSDRVRITEVVQTWEPSGYTCIPTLESMSKEDIDPEGGATSETVIKEYLATLSTEFETASINVSWVDPYGSSEDATITTVTHDGVKMTTQLMSIQYMTGADIWKVTILKDGVSVYNILDGTTRILNKMMTMEWNYSEEVNYELSYTS